jgi:hypothetical protein
VDRRGRLYIGVEVKGGADERERKEARRRGARRERQATKEKISAFRRKQGIEHREGGSREAKEAPRRE